MLLPAPPSCRAHDWVATTIEWLTSELSGSSDAAASSQAGALGTLSSSNGSSNGKDGAMMVVTSETVAMVTTDMTAIAMVARNNGCFL